MNLQDLQDKLRAHIRARIGRGELTGTGLSREAGFQQGHLSNFLNARRGLSLESMDRLLETLNIGVLDLADLTDIQQQVSFPAVGFENVAVVSGVQAASQPRFTPEQVLESRNFSKSFLRRLKPNDAGNRGDWLRFVLLRLDFRRSPGVASAEPAALRGTGPHRTRQELSRLHRGPSVPRGVRGLKQFHAWRIGWALKYTDG